MNLDALSDHLQWMRRAAGLTQAALAARMETTQPHVARLESGTVMPSLLVLERWAKGTGIPLTLRLDATAAPTTVAPPRRRTVISAPQRDDPGDLWWVTASPQERGDVLRDLLGLVDALPPRPRSAAPHPPLIPRG